MKRKNYRYAKNFSVCVFVVCHIRTVGFLRGYLFFVGRLVGNSSWRGYCGQRERTHVCVCGFSPMKLRAADSSGGRGSPQKEW